MIKPHRKLRSTNYAGTNAVGPGTSRQSTHFDRKIRVLDMINTDQCARELLDHRVAQVNATGRYENAIYCSSGLYVDKLLAKGHKVYVVDTPRNLSPIKLIAAIWKTFCLLRREGFDVAHVHGCVVGLIGRVAAALARTPFVIYQPHGFHHHERMSPLKRWIFIKAEQALSLLTDKLLLQTKTSVVDCQRNNIAPDNKVVWIGNGIQLGNFKADKEPHNDPPIILYATRMECIKNHPMLFEAAQILKERNVAFSIELAGDGQLMLKYQSWVREHNLDDHIVFLCYREDVPALITNADICVLVSEKEGLPRGIMEAAAVGRPMIATDVMGNRETLVDGKTGFLVPLNDAEALANRLEQLLCDPELRRQIGQQAQAYAREYFDEQVVTERIISVYDELVQNYKKAKKPL